MLCAMFFDMFDELFFDTSLHIGAPGGTRTHKTQLLRLVRIPIPSQAHEWCLPEVTLLATTDL